MSTNPYRVRIEDTDPKDPARRSKSPTESKSNEDTAIEQKSEPDEAVTFHTNPEQSALVSGNGTEAFPYLVGEPKESPDSPRSTNSEVEVWQQIAELETSVAANLRQRELPDLTESEPKSSFKKGLQIECVFELFEGKDKQYIGSMKRRTDARSGGKINHDHFAFGGETFDMIWASSIIKEDHL